MPRYLPPGFDYGIKIVHIYLESPSRAIHNNNNVFNCSRNFAAITCGIFVLQIVRHPREFDVRIFRPPCKREKPALWGHTTKFSKTLLASSQGATLTSSPPSNRSCEPASGIFASEISSPFSSVTFFRSSHRSAVALKSQFVEELISPVDTIAVFYV